MLDIALCDNDNRIIMKPFPKLRSDRRDLDYRTPFVFVNTF